MQTYLDSLVNDGAAGVLLHYRSPGGTWIGTSGVAELGTDRPVDPDGWFRAGSITKTFTAVVVLQLVGEGALKLDDPVTEWLPDLPASISLRQLLNHTSGLYNYTDDLPEPEGIVRDRYVHRDPRDSLRVGLEKPRLFEPGASWSYSNTNYIALGLLIEALTGNAYGDEVARRILRPLRLERTVVTTDESYGYGLGIERRRLPDGQVLWGHTGGIFGYLTLSHHSQDLSRQVTLSYTGTSAEAPETGQVLAGLFA